MSKACYPQRSYKLYTLDSRNCWYASLKMNVDYFSKSMREKSLSYCRMCSVALAAVLGWDANLYALVPKFTAAESDVLTYSFKLSLN